MSPTPGIVTEQSSAMDVRVKTFRAEATARMGFLVEDLGFAGPEFADHGASYPVTMTLIYYRWPLRVQVTLILSYAGEEYLYTSVAVTHTDGHSDRSEISSNTVHTGFQMRRALDRQAIALRTALKAEQT
jgi:hypothetical protein